MLLRIKNAGILALMLLAAVPAMAQGPGGGGGGRGGPGGQGRGGSLYSLLQNEAVQKELELSDDQKTKATALVESFREAQRGQAGQGGQGGGENFRDLSQEQRRERFAALAKEGEERNAKALAEFKPKFAEVLDEVQTQRLQQIFWQSQGTRALRDADVAKALNLTPEQQTKIAGLFTDAGGQGGFGGGPGGNRGPGGAGGPGGDRGQGGNDQDREARMTEMRARMEKLNTEVKAVLTDAQKTEFTNLLGAEFDVSQLRGQGGPGGDRGQGGRNRGGDRQQGSGNNI